MGADFLHFCSCCVETQNFASLLALMRLHPRHVCSLLLVLSAHVSWTQCIASLHLLNIWHMVLKLKSCPEEQLFQSIDNFYFLDLFAGCFFGALAAFSISSRSFSALSLGSIAVILSLYAATSALSFLL